MDTSSYLSKHSVIDAIQGKHPTNPLDALSEALGVAESMASIGDAVIEHFVAAAREQGRSWTQIATSLGVSRQAAHRKFDGVVPGPQDAPMGIDGIREKAGPFCATRMAEDGSIEVLLETGGSWYQLESLDGYSVEHLVHQARQAYGPKWLKRLGEDLDCVYGLVGGALGDSVQATVLDAAGRRSTKEVECTIAKRKTAWRYNARTVEVPLAKII
jgi:hypothetical protein